MCEHVEKLEYFCCQDSEYACEGCSQENHAFHNVIAVKDRAKILIKSMGNVLKPYSYINKKTHHDFLNVERYCYEKVGDFIKTIEDSFQREIEALKLEMYNNVKRVVKYLQPFEENNHIKSMYEDFYKLYKLKKYIEVTKGFDGRNLNKLKITEKESFVMKNISNIDENIKHAYSVIDIAYAKYKEATAKKIKFRQPPSYTKLFYTALDSPFLHIVDVKTFQHKAVDTGFKSLKGALTYIPDKNKLFMCGGGTGTCKETYEFDFMLGEFEYLGDMNHQRHYGHAFIQISSDYLIAIGGVDEVSTLNKCEFFKISTNEWAHFAHLNTPRCYPTAICPDEHSIYVIGGQNYKDSFKNTIEKYDKKTDSFITLKIANKHQLPHSSIIGYIILDSRNILLFGGKSKNGKLDSSVVFNTEENRIIPAQKNLPKPCTFKQINHCKYKGKHYCISIDGSMLMYEDDGWDILDNFLKI